MKIPDSIRIGGVNYPVEYIPDLNDGKQMLCGKIDYQNCKISLSDTYHTAHEARCLTIWHEVLHGVADHAGLKIENEEVVIETLCKGIYQVLQDNGGKFFDLREVTNDN